jgi:hypothetical protein
LRALLLSGITDPLVDRLQLRSKPFKLGHYKDPEKRPAPFIDALKRPAPETFVGIST